MQGLYGDCVYYLCIVCDYHYHLPTTEALIHRYSLIIYSIFPPINLFILSIKLFFLADASKELDASVQEIIKIKTK